MKVLWFSNTPANAFVKNMSKGTGSWLVPLNKEVQHKVELSVAFPYPYKMKNFRNEETSYFPIYTGPLIWSKLKDKFFNKVFEEELLPRYMEIINEVKPDIIHIHGSEMPFACLIPHVEIPVVLSVQGNITVYYNKFKSGLGDKFIHISKFSLNPMDIAFATNFYHNYKQRGKKSRIELKQLKNVRYVIGRTDWDRRITSVMSPKSKYFVGQEMMRPSFHINEWIPQKDNSAIRIFTTNGDSYFKGFETICQCLSILTSYGYHIEWAVAGVNESSLIYKIVKKYLKESFPKIGLRLLGSVTEEVLVKEMLNSHLYVMPSHIENSPNNLCEAMLLGMPCIATVAGGTASLLTDQKEGVLIQDGDAWVMAGAILEFVKNPDVAYQYGKNARMRALERHNNDMIVSDLIQTYKDIIDDYKIANE